jgi:drug/metabolite transporter (DMT)-like permease
MAAWMLVIGPLVGTLLGWLFLGEQVGITFWIGTLLILGGVLLTIKDKEYYF